MVLFDDDECVARRPYRVLAIHPGQTHELRATGVQVAGRLIFQTTEMGRQWDSVALDLKTRQFYPVVSSSASGVAAHHFLPDGSRLEFYENEKQVIQTMQLVTRDEQVAWAIRSLDWHEILSMAVDIQMGLIYVLIRQRMSLKWNIICLSLATGSMHADTSSLNLSCLRSPSYVSMCVDQSSHRLTVVQSTRLREFDVIVMSPEAGFACQHHDTILHSSGILHSKVICQNNLILYISQSSCMENDAVLVYHLGLHCVVCRIDIPGYIRSMAWEPQLSALLVTVHDQNIVYMIDCSEDVETYE